MSLPAEQYSLTKTDKGVTRLSVWGLGVMKKAGWLTVAKEKAEGHQAWWKEWWHHWNGEKQSPEE